jgi:hypothetical protein
MLGKGEGKKQGRTKRRTKEEGKRIIGNTVRLIWREKSTLKSDAGMSS